MRESGQFQRKIMHLDYCLQAFDMYPVSEPARAQLYDGFSKQGKGRHQYLKERKQLIPENKYQFPLCSSWDYGWKLEDAIPRDSIKNPPYGRRAIVENDFFTRNEIPQYHKDRHAKEDDARAHILMENKWRYPQSTKAHFTITYCFCMQVTNILIQFLKDDNNNCLQWIRY